MYVVEASATESMKISVLSLAGSRWTVDVMPEVTIDKLKMMALSHFYNPMDSIKVADRYKLILVSDGRPLSDEGTVRDENIQNNDELLLLKRRPSPKSVAESSREKDEKIHGPSDTEIQKITASITPKNMDYVPEDMPVVVDFHSELRKILVSLVQTSEKILRKHPDIVDLFKEAEESEQAESNSGVDGEALKQLTDMGFPENRAINALKINNNPESAAEWLLNHGEEDCEESSNNDTSPCTYVSAKSHDNVPFSEPCSSKQADHIFLSETSQEISKDESPLEDNSQNESPVVRILRSFRSYKRKVFRPNKIALNSLKEMGFSETDVLDALRINGNNQDTACDWLLSDKKMSFDDVSCGLDPDGPIYKAIMENSIVQLGLCNPKTFLALLHMLENPNNACRWLSDPDTAPILSQIFRIYHAEKHSLQLARPFFTP